MTRNSTVDFAPNNPAILTKIKCANIVKSVGGIALLSLSAPSFGSLVTGSTISSPVNSEGSSVKENNRPVAKPDVLLLEKSSIAFNALANDVDPDGDRLIMVEALANYGAVAFTPEGLLAYAQETGQLRADKITYKVSDGRGGFGTATVEISVR